MAKCQEKWVGQIFLNAFLFRLKLKCRLRSSRLIGFELVLFLISRTQDGVSSVTKHIHDFARKKILRKATSLVSFEQKKRECARKCPSISTAKEKQTSHQFFLKKGKICRNEEKMKYMWERDEEKMEKAANRVISVPPPTRFFRKGGGGRETQKIGVRRRGGTPPGWGGVRR